MNSVKEQNDQALNTTSYNSYVSDIDESFSFSDSNSDNKVLPKGTLPSQTRIENMLQKMLSQIQILTQTVGMLDSRLDILQSEVNRLSKQNNIE
ncbi:hypothetical protein GPJ56_008885 [Histomonas meleagridis]|uniref:uncharacterized protein n=1 Tax=Histomonas meleagridis TaxID=135588 RepID=UPI00355AB270|nr:hypothetical protein GPJ56_008885 [Histomonas meleagridis]KAH0797811.1 hypothetical protein GO595_009440 [Histomonas meleagridis]